MADPTVQLRLSIEGQNKAGAAIKQAEDQAAALGKRMSAVAERSGDVERGFLGLKDIAATLSPQAQVIADVAGGLEGLVKGMGGLFGPIGMAIGVVAAAAAGVYALVTAHEKELALVRAKNLQLLSEQPRYVLQHYGISKDLLGTEKQTYEVAKLRAELTQQANATLALEVKLKQDLAEGNKAEASAGAVRLAQAKDRLAVLAEDLRFAQTLAASDALRAAAATRNEVALQLESQRIAQIADTRVRLAEQERVARRQMLQTEAELAKVRMEAVKADVDAQVAIATGDAKAQEAAAARIAKASERVKALVGQQVSAEQSLASIAAQRDADDQQRQQKRQQQTQAAIAARQRAEQARAKAEQESDRVSKELADQLLERGTRRLRQLQQEIEWQKAKDSAYATAQQNLRDAQIDAETDPAKRAELEYLDKRRKLMQELIAIQLDTTREARTAAAEQAAIQLRLLAIETQEKDRIKQGEKEKRDAKISAAFSVADATVDAMGKIGLAERAQAGGRAILAVAEGLYAVTRQGVAGVPQLLTGLASAAQFALASGQSAPAVPAAASAFGGGAGTGPQPRSLAPSGMGGGGPVTINVTGAVIGTPQQVGMHVQKAAKSLKGTGFPAKAGA